LDALTREPVTPCDSAHRYWFNPLLHWFFA